MIDITFFEYWFVENNVMGFLLMLRLFADKLSHNTGALAVLNSHFATLVNR